MIANLKNKNIYLAPKNNFTVDFNYELKNKQIITKGYFDNFNTDDDIITKPTFGKNDIVIIFSPNHWEEIADNLNTQNIYILNVIEAQFIIKKLDEFEGYKSIPKFNSNRFSIQKYHWNNHLEEFYKNGKNIEKYGYEWGNPDNTQDELGNYLSINNQLCKLISNNSNIVEIGTLGGKWTKYMLKANKIICVDINEYFIEAINKRYESYINKFEFYISSGNELNGIKTNSIDVVFCMDTLVRVEKKYIYDYIKEISRILNMDGKAIIHLPNSDVEDCVKREFTDLNTNEINNELCKYFSTFRLDSTTIVHGTLVYINC